MNKWVSAKETLPDIETACLVSTRVLSMASWKKYCTYPLSAAWDGKEWVDVNGDIVYDVEYWQELPKVDERIGIIEKLIGCVENEHCENKDCCYFTTFDELEALLKYMKGQEENHE